MMTLDEVIKGFECCENTDCGNCPYKILFNDDSHVPCDQFSKDEDALQWLKGYRAHIELDKLRDKCETENDPLSWDELRTMEGKPVWVEYGTDEDTALKCWCLVLIVLDEYISLVTTAIQFRAEKSKQGTTWQAYRKERE